MIAGIMIGVLVSSLFWAWLVNKENRYWYNYCINLNEEWADRCKILINEAFDEFYKEVRDGNS